MRPDHYATLGVSPDASTADIRAAYLKLLREFHPDRNRSPEAVERTAAIIAAFKVVSDFDQRSYYDWDRRRDREAAEAAAAARVPRRFNRAGLAAGGLGLAAIGAWLLLPSEPRTPNPNAPVTASIEPGQELPVRVATATPVAEPEKSRVETVRMPPLLPDKPEARLAERTVETGPPPLLPRKIAPTPDIRVAEARPAPKPRAPDIETRPIRVAAALPPKPVPATATARPSSPRSGGDIASLDQFVMNFYGQSWRYGDAPKRAVLEKTRASFVARRGACMADTCRRNAYLDLMRDVSSIVETGKPEPR